MTNGTFDGAVADVDVDENLSVLAGELRVLRDNVACETAMLELYVLARIDELLDRRLDRVTSTPVAGR